MIENTEWDINIGDKKSLFNIDIKEIWRFRDLLLMFVKKDIITVYKQTLLGPIWFVVQPMLTSLMFLLIFTSIAKIPTSGVPPVLFYLLGTTLWNYFSDTLLITSKTFTDNASVFGKVYFPRLILPLSKVVSGLIKFLIQFSLFLIIWAYYLLVSKSIIPNWYILLSPLLLLLIIAIALGFGILITSLTTKYRDLVFLIAFGVQLAMYATPIIIPLSEIHGKKRLIFLLNPLTSLFEAIKFGFLGKGFLNAKWILYSSIFTVVLLVCGILMFNKVEKRFIDTV